MLLGLTLGIGEKKSGKIKWHIATKKGILHVKIVPVESWADFCNP